jgi:hypothetical protein
MGVRRIYERIQWVVVFVWLKHDPCIATGPVNDEEVAVKAINTGDTASYVIFLNIFTTWKTKVHVEMFATSNTCGAGGRDKVKIVRRCCIIQKG